MAVKMAEAQALAAEELRQRGFVFVEEAAEWRHPDGTRGRMTYHPDFSRYSSTFTDVPKDGDDLYIGKVQLQRPNQDHLVGGFIPILDFTQNG